MLHHIDKTNEAIIKTLELAELFNDIVLHGKECEIELMILLRWFNKNDLMRIPLDTPEMGNFTYEEEYLHKIRFDDSTPLGAQCALLFHVETMI